MQLRAIEVLRRMLLARERRKIPPCPAGWTTAPPDFVGVAAQRSGTTWWDYLVESHPDVVSRESDKELHFFNSYWGREFTDADAAKYARYFPRPAGKISGEWSPGYLSHFWVAPLLQRSAPDAKILVLLRDPVERFRSGLGLQSETRRLNFTGAGTALRVGCYGSQMEQLLHHFPREQVLVLQFERCLLDAKGELLRTYEFIGLNEFVPSDIAEQRNESRVTKPDLPEHTRASLIEVYTPEVQRLTSLVPEIDLSLWPNFAKLA